MTRRQEIIFRFTIPADPSSIPRLPDRSSVTGNVTNGTPNGNTSTGSCIVASDYFTVCAFGTEYLVEYPSGITGFRRPCTNRLGYISLPTYYDSPPVEHLGGRRYRVHVPKEILLSGENEFYVSLPSDTTGTTTTDSATRPASPHPPPFQVRLVVPDTRPTILEFDAPEDTLSTGAIPCRWKKAQSPKTTFQVMIPPLSHPPTTPTPTTHSRSSSHSHCSSHAMWDQTQFILTSLGSLPAVVTRPADASDDSLITFSVPLRAMRIYSKTINNHAMQSHQGHGTWHRLYHVTTNRLQWFYFLSPSSSSLSSSHSMVSNSARQRNDGKDVDPQDQYDPTMPQLHLASQVPAAWVCHLVNLETTFLHEPIPSLQSTSSSSSLSPSSHHCPRRPTKRTPWSLVPIHQAQGLPVTVWSRDRKTLDGYPQIIGSFWDLVMLNERQRQRTMTQWRLKLQGEGRQRNSNGNGSGGTTALTMLHIQPDDASSDIGQLLQTICEAVETQLVSPSHLRGPWGIPGPLFGMDGSSFCSSSSCCWMSHLAQKIVQYELQPTPGNQQRWEFRSTSRLDPCHLLGILVGKSLVQGNSPLFSPQIQLATYLYKFLLQWPIQHMDYLQVLVGDSSGESTKGTTTTSTLITTDCEALDHQQLLFDRLFESTKDPISSFLDGVFVIVPLSFMLVFRTIKELEDCLVDTRGSC